MRLGKTLVAVRTSKVYNPPPDMQKKILVVAPSSTFADWLQELELEGESGTLLIGPRKKRLQLLSEDLTWYIMNREGHRSIPEIADARWTAVILDESTFIKNPKIKTTQFYCSNFRRVPHRMILSGLPAPESEMDFFQQLFFLDGEAFGFKSFWDFRIKLYEPEPNGYGWIPKPGTLELVRSYLAERACVIRRKDVGLDTPKLRERRFIKLSGKARRTYETAEREFILEYEGEEVARTTRAIGRYTWLRQLAGGFVKDRLVWDAKFKELKQLVTEDLRDQPLVVWFRYNAELHHAESLLSESGVSCQKVLGGGDLGERVEVFRSFQRGEFRVLLLQIAIAEYGLNLSRAETAIYYSNPTGQLARAQTEDRILKPGKKSQTPLLYIDLLAEDTVDADIRDLLIAKRTRSITTLDLIRKMQERRDA
jgi:SNF2 family DNA or RNA helicase